MTSDLDYNFTAAKLRDALAITGLDIIPEFDILDEGVIEVDANGPDTEDVAFGEGFYAAKLVYRAHDNLYNGAAYFLKPNGGRGFEFYTNDDADPVVIAKILRDALQNRGFFPECGMCGTRIPSGNICHSCWMNEKFCDEGIDDED